jgi:hypothetical protein
MEAVKSQQPFDACEHRRVIVHDKNGPAGWQGVTPPASSLAPVIAPFLARRHQTFILSLCAGRFGEHRASLQNAD